ncbi:MAG: ABC transporter ATP-binding protein [Proteobacteria bacterium]|nr:ABC transporter ATP-binding protein [Pseudomonadota bacterium]
MLPAIEVSSLLFEYPGVRALDDVSFSVAEGSVTALVGPNGAGKTTLLRCLAGLEEPLLGSITVSGVDVLEEPRAVHRRIGYLSDFYGLYDALTVRQCFAHAAAAHGVRDAALDAAVNRTAERLDLADLVARRAAELSRGQRQRVAIGQALIHDPQVLMLDEPASGLDPEARHSLALLFTRLAGEGMTLLVSSHILAELDEYSTHMLVMRQGRIIESKPLGGAASGTRQVRIVFAREVADLGAALAAIAGIRVLEAGARDALVEIAGDAQAQSEVLRALVLAGLPVTAFSAERENLHQSYLRTVAGRGQ